MKCLVLLFILSGCGLKDKLVYKELYYGDNVTVISGFYKGCKGTVKDTGVFSVEFGVVFVSFRYVFYDVVYCSFIHFVPEEYPAIPPFFLELFFC